jgi:hypothetical protein
LIVAPITIPPEIAYGIQLPSADISVELQATDALASGNMLTDVTTDIVATIANMKTRDVLLM